MLPVLLACIVQFWSGCYPCLGEAPVVWLPAVICSCSLFLSPKVNHLSKRHPDMKIEEVPELTLPIIKPNRDYFCQYCDKVCGKSPLGG